MWVAIGVPIEDLIAVHERVLVGALIGGQVRVLVRSPVGFPIGVLVVVPMGIPIGGSIRGSAVEPMGHRVGAGRYCRRQWPQRCPRTCMRK